MALPYVLGHNLRLYAGETTKSAIAHARTCKITYSKETKKINHKDINPGSEGGGFSESTGGVKSAKGTSTFYIYKSGSSLSTLKTAWKNDTILELSFTTGVSGEFEDKMNVLITELDITAEDDSVAEATVSFESVGEITFATSTGTLS